MFFFPFGLNVKKKKMPFSWQALFVFGGDYQTLGIPTMVASDKSNSQLQKQEIKKEHTTGDIRWKRHFKEVCFPALISNRHFFSTSKPENATQHSEI